MREVVRHDAPVSDRLHPLVYAAIAGLALWLVVSVWGFAGAGYTDYLLAVVSGFIFIAVAIPFMLWLNWRRGNEEARAHGGTFREWASGDFDTWQCRVKGSNAALEILLPIAAVAFGMTAFALVFLFTTPGGG